MKETRQPKMRGILSLINGSEYTDFQKSLYATLEESSKDNSQNCCNHMELQFYLLTPAHHGRTDAPNEQEALGSTWKHRFESARRNALLPINKSMKPLGN